MSRNVVKKCLHNFTIYVKIIPFKEGVACEISLQQRHYGFRFLLEFETRKCIKKRDSYCTVMLCDKSLFVFP